MRRTTSMACLTLLCTVLAAGCGSATDQAVAPSEGESAAADAATVADPLAGTAWRLVELRSTDEAVETLRPTDPSVFTMHLKDDGSVATRLDCNRANGTWSSEPEGDGTSGRLAFGPLAMTRALCPPPHLDEKIAAHAGLVRSYRLEDGGLALTLTAEGEVSAWERLEAGGSAAPAEPEGD